MSTVDRATEPVFRNRTRYGAGDAIAASSGPMQKNMVTSVMNPSKTLKI